MKTVLSGIITVIVVGLIALLILRGRGLVQFPGENASSPTPVASANFEFASPTPVPSAAPKSSVKPSGVVKGEATSTPKATYSPRSISTTTVTTTTVSHVKLTLMDSDKCPTTTVAEIKDIQGKLTLKYSLKEDYSANITAWKSNGEEVIKQTRVEDSGDLKTIEGMDYLKIQIQSDHCVKNDEHWIKVTAER